MKYVIGIDEVGRGPIAGPLVVCACAISEGIDVLGFFPKGILKDSKKLSEKNRVIIKEKADAFIGSKKIVYGIGEVAAEDIDREGLVASIENAISTALKKIHDGGVPGDSFIYLDGALKADEKFSQETIIKGDEKNESIALASIIAKVHRDALMRNISKDFPLYGFERHVGYGTKFHYDAIGKYGLSKYHRKSFLRNFMK